MNTASAEPGCARGFGLQHQHHAERNADRAANQERPQPPELEGAAHGPDQTALVDHSAGHHQQRGVDRRDRMQPDRRRDHAIGKTRRARRHAAEKSAQHDETDGLRRKSDSIVGALEWLVHRQYFRGLASCRETQDNINCPQSAAPAKQRNIPHVRPRNPQKPSPTPCTPASAKRFAVDENLSGLDELAAHRRPPGASALYSTARSIRRCCGFCAPARCRRRARATCSRPTS